MCFQNWFADTGTDTDADTDADTDGKVFFYNEGLELCLGLVVDGVRLGAVVLSLGQYSIPAEG
jgi:hypothetical protein